MIPIRITAKGKLKSPYKNSTEADYAQLLELRRRAGELVWWAYEGIKFRLADGAWYTVDFVVMLPDGTIQCHEVKGFWREAAKVRIRVASSVFPFEFLAVKKTKKGWETEEF